MIPCQVEKLPRLRKYLGTTQEPRELPAPSAAVLAAAGLNSLACSADVLMTVADKSSLSTSISATRHWSFFFTQPSAPSRTFHFQDTQACSLASYSTRVSHLASSTAKSSQRLSQVIFSNSQESDTQDFPRQVHSVHFNLLLSSDIQKQGLWFKTQKSHRASDTKL